MRGGKAHPIERVALFLISAVALPVVQCPAQRAPGAAPLAITHVTVVDVSTGTLARDHTVVIAGDRIRAVGSAASMMAPDDARVVDGTGKYLIPGLWDMHAHVTWPFQVFALPLMVATGVTGGRDMWGTLTTAHTVSEEARRGVRIAPRLVVAGNLVDGPPGVIKISTLVDTPARGRAVVDSLARAGAAFIKVYGLLTPDVYTAIAERSRQVGIPFAGHVPHRVRAADASDAGQRSMEHLIGILEGCSTDEPTAMRLALASTEAEAHGDGLSAVWRADSAAYTHLINTFDPVRCDALLQRLARNGTAVVPTQALFRHWVVPDRIDSADARFRYVPTWLRGTWPALGSWWSRGADAAEIGARYWALRQRVVKRMSELGVLLLAGTDAGGLPFTVPGFMLHTELQMFVAAGLTPLQALQTGTLNPALFLGASDSLGTVAPGKLADLVLLDADPLRDITNTQKIRAVVLGGRYLDRTVLDQLLREAATTASAKQR